MLFHTPGLHELDDLRQAEPAIERIIEDDAVPSAPNDVVVIHDEPESAPPIPPAATAPLVTRTPPRVDTVPQGVFDVDELTDRLASTDADPAALLETIGKTPRAVASSTATPEPWRVVVTCPQAEGDPPVHHDVVFVGTGSPEARFVQGTRPDRSDEILEHDAAALAPGIELARTERRLAALLIGELVVTAAIVALTWMSGGLAAAARETPFWLALAAGLVLAAVAFGGITLLSPRDPRGNVNDTYEVRRFYSSRLELLHLATAVSAGAFALALVVGYLPPVIALAEVPRPAATVRFTGAADVATVEVHVEGVGAGSEVAVQMDAFTTADAAGSTIGLVTTTGDAAGSVDTTQTVSIPAGADFLAVVVTPEGQTPSACTPLAADGPGCTVLALPSASGPTVTTSSPSATAPTPSPSVSSSVTPSPVTPSPVTTSPVVPGVG